MLELDEEEEGAEDDLDVDIFSLCEKATINRLVTSRAHHKGFTEDDCKC
jgi:hypothetical protein